MRGRAHYRDAPICLWRVAIYPAGAFSKTNVLAIRMTLLTNDVPGVASAERDDRLNAADSSWSERIACAPSSAALTYRFSTVEELVRRLSF